jgi:hypothetical protein
MATAFPAQNSGDLAPRAPADDLHWAFSEDANGRWRWGVTARSGQVVVRSAVRFDSRAECVADATRYGYAEDAWRAARRA